MDTETQFQQKDNTTIGKIASAAGIVTGITGGVITAGVINIAILSLGTPILGPEITVGLNLTGGLYASYTSIKASINISEKYVTPVVKNILHSSVNYFVKSKSTQQDMDLPMIVPNENKQLPVTKEPDHLPMKVADMSAPSIAKKAKEAKPALKEKNSKKSAKPTQNTANLKKPKITSQKNSGIKKKDAKLANTKDSQTRG